MQLPSGQLHGTSFNFATLPLRGFTAGKVGVRLSALLAFAVVVWMVTAGSDIDPGQLPFILTMTGFTWHASVELTWFRRR
ncbi:hypothetical protein ABZX62_04875 [Streptomyces flavidovirens]|uniref:Integral membrane protein n=1 Tax=Streptomyces flavidovirens TaxID=67298 RepID=A0ABW6RFS8_9ACTN